ncbi:hypothetical protein E2562_017477 [Oryza meyeriana var. granulata]|uniref:Uncharacterized protein n=1 Tax=Oryza meyeriana var. granulata TaxID=110450 RepID=A0A6G1DY12_9ORYZ|nr:hypothetical protein E2562_017477 [Oryza meyeriana var. granulata]
MVLIAYIDHIQLPTIGLTTHTVNYGVPRFQHFRSKKEIPYYADETIQENTTMQDSASLDEWIRLSSSSSQGFEMPSSIQSVIDKNNSIWENDVDSVVAFFSRSMKNLHAKHTAEMISDIKKVLAADNVPTKDIFEVGLNPNG